MPQTAWNLYFRFCRKAASHPHLQIDWNELGMLDKEQYKNYVVAILNTESTLQSELKYGGCDSFGGMSKDLGQRWKDADDLTKSVFNELASEESKRYKKVCFLLACTELDSSTPSSQTYESTYRLLRRSTNPTKPSPRSFRNQISWR
jgi:hypothetical protein